MTQDGLESALADACERARVSLSSLPAGSRSPAVTLFAAAATERLFRWYDAAPADERRPYSETWRPVVADVWSWLRGDAGAYRRIAHALGRFYASPYCNDGQDGPDDIDQDEAAAALYTANSVMHGIVDFALWAATRATDHLDTRWHGVDEGRRVAEISAELRRQREDLDLICRTANLTSFSGLGVPTALVDALRN